MSDRKYRQRGYQDNNRDRAPRQPGPGPRRNQVLPREPAGSLRTARRTSTCPGSGTSSAAPSAGNLTPEDIGFNESMFEVRCRASLVRAMRVIRPGQPIRVPQPVSERVSPKSARNGCTFFSPRTTVERETTTPRNNDARKAFDDLFKF